MFIDLPYKNVFFLQTTNKRNRFSYLAYIKKPIVENDEHYNIILFLEYNLSVYLLKTGVIFSEYAARKYFQ